MGEIAGQNGQLAWQEIAIARTAGLDQAGEHPGNAQGIQRADNGKLGLKVFAVLAAGGAISRHGRLARAGRDLAAGILDQHGHVPGRPAAHRVLEIEQADPRLAGPFGQPDQVFRMIVAQGEDTGARKGLRDQGFALLGPALRGCLAPAHLRVVFRHPVGELVGIGPERQCIEIKDRPDLAMAARGLRRRGRVQVSEQLRRAGV